MIKRTLSELRAGPHSLAKKLFIGYLALVTGCTSPLQQVEQSAAIVSQREQANSGNVYTVAGTAESVQTKQANKYNLPELGGAVDKEESVKSTILDDISGGLLDPARQDIASPLSKGYEGANALQGMAVGALTSAATEGVKNWFSAKNSTAELAFSAGERGAFTGSFDLLVPVYDNKTDLVFAQVGFRRSNAYTEDYRNTVNVGAGYRRNIDNWLAGVNVFYDRDLTGKNGRFSIGAEAFTDNFKASGNLYIRATEWHKSPDLEDYLERPANGYDLRIDANLPSYPQLGGKLVYEQYFGDQVGLFGSSNRQKDPQAVTVGLTYNPVPMIGFGVDYRQGQGGVSETSGKLTINYQFGVPLSKQLSLDYSKSHKLENSRFDLVNRRYDVILDYKEKDAGQVMLPALVNGTPTQAVSFPITVTDHTIGSFSWTGTAAQYALPYGGGSTASVVLPAYQENGNNLYTLQAIGTDRFGRVIQSNVMQIRVDAFLIALDRSASTVKADGNDEVMFTAMLQEPTGAAKANTTVVWDVRGAAQVVEQDERTDRQGKARLTLTSRFASAVRVTVQEPQGAKAESSADFSGDQRTAKVIGLTATPSTITADGKARSKLVATIADANGNPVGPGAPVTWSTTAGELASASTITNEDSTATVELTSATTVGVAKVTAKAVAGSADTSVAFTADNATARILSLVATPAAIPADGVATSELVAVIEDGNGNPVGVGIPVSWNSTAGKLSSQTSVTDANSQTKVTLTSATLAGSSTVTAKASAGGADVAVSFDPNSRTAKVIELVATPASIKANGSDVSELVATVEDAHGNPVAGAPITWTTSLGQLSSLSSSTDAQGLARVTLKGTAAGTAAVKAAAAAGASSASVTLIADGSTAKVIDLVATPASIKANGSDVSELVATVEDAHGNPVAGAPIAWTTSLGQLSSLSSSTDAQGLARVTLQGTAAGTAAVKAAAAAGASSASVTLIADGSTAKVIDLVATPASIKANGSDVSELVATVEDAHGNPVAGAPITWTTSLGQLSSLSSSTDAQGLARVTLQGTAAGTAAVKAAAAAGASSASVTLIADGSTAKVIDLVATPASIKANGSDVSELVATVEDAHGNPVAGAPIAWTTSLGQLSSLSSSTDAQGLARVTLQGTAAGTAAVKAAAAAGASSASVTLIADGSTAKVIDLVATPASIKANNSDVSELVATVEDAHGNPVAGAPITWTTSLGQLSATSSSTDAQGLARVTLKGTAAGTAAVKAAAAAGASSASVTLIADTSTATVADLVATPASIPANGTDTSTLSATVRDAHGNSLGSGITVTFSTSTGTLSDTTATTNSSGVASVTLRGTVSATASVTAKATTAATRTASVVLFADGSTAKVIDLVATPSSIKANGSASSELVATVEDAHGNPVAGVPIAWSTSLGQLSSFTSFTDVQGLARVTLKGTAVGTAAVKATAAAGASSANVTLIADSSTARVMDLVATPASIKANGSDVSELVATVEDAHGNPVAGAPITWTTSLGQLSAGSSSTDAQGLARVTLKGTAAGTAAVKAAAAAGASSASVTLIADGSTAKVIDLVATPASIKANGSDVSELVATVEDAHGNPVAGAPITWTTSLGQLSSLSSSTDAQGMARVTLKGTVTGTAAVKAAAAAGASSASVTLIADTSTATVTDLVASPTTIVANGSAASTLSATVVDGQGNALGVGITVTFGTNVGTLSATTATTNASGVASVSLRGTVAGTATVTAKAATAATKTASVALVADNSTATVADLVASPATIIANGSAASTLSATVVDGQGNALGAGITVTFGTNAGTLSAPTATTNASGVASVSLRGTVAGTATVTAKAATAATKSASVALVADTSTATVADLVASPAAIVANGSAASTLRATVVDGQGNALGSGITVTFGTNTGTLSATTATTNASGEASVSLRGTVAGTATVTAKAATAATKSASVALFADANTATIIGLVPSPSTIRANASDISWLYATVRDANGNVLPPGQTVTFATNLGSLNASSAATDTNGIAVVGLYGSIPGTATVTATTAAGRTGSTAVVLTSVAPNINSISVYSGGGHVCQGRTQNVVCVDGDGGTFGTYETEVVFSWAVTNADRYELVDPGGTVIYSGTGTSVNLGGREISQSFWRVMPQNGGSVTYTLRAYNSTMASEATITPHLTVYRCGGGCST